MTVSPRRLLVPTILTALAVASSGAVGAEPLTLRINDAIAVPGGRAALVIRTYSPRPVGQGQIDIGPITEGVVSGPFEALESAEVWSSNDDAVVEAFFDDTTQSLDLDLSSATASINSVDGPLAVLVFRLREDLQPGETFLLSLDGAGTSLLDADGNPIPLELRGGDLTIRDPLGPILVEADGDSVNPGAVVHLAIGTQELLPLQELRARFLYDPSLARALPWATFDPRFGNASLTYDESVPGQIDVVVSSPDTTLGELPGDLVTIHLPIRHDVGFGTTSPVSLDAAGTELLDELGDPLPLSLGGDVIEIENVSELLDDGFESGDLRAWNSE